MDDTLQSLIKRIGYPVRIGFRDGRWYVAPVKGEAGVPCPLRARSGPTLSMALERVACDADAMRAENADADARCDEDAR